MTACEVNSTSVDNLVSVKEIDGKKDLLDGFSCILLGEFSLFADSIKKLSACRELGNDVELVLKECQPISSWNLIRGLTRDSNQSTNLTI